MKKVIFMVAVVAFMSVMVTSCKKDKAEEVKTEVEAVVDEAKEEAQEVLASNDVLHQCPMDCEKGKSYTEPGKCPVCKMDLKEKQVDTKLHTENCTCKEGGDCTCEGGECQCQA